MTMRKIVCAIMIMAMAGFSVSCSDNEPVCNNESGCEAYETDTIEFVEDLATDESTEVVGEVSEETTEQI